VKNIDQDTNSLLGSRRLSLNMHRQAHLYCMNTVTKKLAEVANIKAPKFQNFLCQTIRKELEFTYRHKHLAGQCFAVLQMARVSSELWDDEDYLSFLSWSQWRKMACGLLAAMKASLPTSHQVDSFHTPPQGSTTTLKLEYNRRENVAWTEMMEQSWPMETVTSI
jgi:hypothetical protein